jgi:DNA polymerase/3'-5' exonuclease PolX
MHIIFMNENIILMFEKLIAQIKSELKNLKGKDKIINGYRIGRLTKSLEIIKKYPKKIINGSDLEKYSGIGKGTIRRINEIIKTGKLDELKPEEHNNDLIDGYIEELVKIFGIGRKKAYDLYQQYNIKNLDDLKKAHESGEIILPDQILIGLKYVDLITRNIPRKIIDNMYIFLIKKSLEVDPQLEIRICGSYRREKNTVNDVDIIIVHPKIIKREQAEKSNMLRKYIELLFSEKFMIEGFTRTDVKTKFMGLCKFSKLIIRIDIRFIPMESYSTALLYFTGSKNFNKTMRRIALDNGYKLNEYELLDWNGEKVKINSEIHIFEILGMEYVMPKDRI